jgi:hypothetical protein
LRDITKLLGIKEEILIESPKRMEAPVSFLNYVPPSGMSTEGMIRKSAVVSPGSPSLNVR